MKNNGTEFEDSLNTKNIRTFVAWIGVWVLIILLGLACMLGGSLDELARYLSQHF